MSIFEYDKEEEEKKLRKAEFEAGVEHGIEQSLVSLVIKKMKKGKSVEEIADMLEETPEKIQNIYELARNMKLYNCFSFPQKKLTVLSFYLDNCPQIFSTILSPLIIFTVILWSIKPKISKSKASIGHSTLMMSFFPILLLLAFLIIATVQSNLSSFKL